MENMVVKSLPEELSVEILVKLAVKPLMRLKCVCKAWYRIIKSPNFVKLHLKQHKDKYDCLLITQSLSNGRGVCKKLLSFRCCESLSVISPDVEIPHSFSQDPEDLWPVKPENSLPCNGLLCFSDTQDLVLANPAMREFKLLPTPFPSPSPSLGEGEGEGEGEGCFVGAFGLGFDSTKNEYKVVAFVWLGKTKGGITKIYNLSSNSWREIEYEFPYAFGPGAPLNGALHWLGRGKKTNKNREFIVSFDLSKEVFGETELPIPDDDDTGMSSYKVIKVLNDDSLIVFDYRIHHGPSQFVDVWVMKESGWSRQSRVGPIQQVIVYRPHMLWKNEAAILCECHDGEVISYAIIGDTHQITKFGISGDGIMLFQESLVSIT